MPDVINKVISLISGGDGEGGSDKDILLKQLAKELSQNKYAKFFRVRQSEVDASLGQFFYNVYKTVYPIQVFLNDPEIETKLKHITLEAFLDKNVMSVLKRLSPEAIAERRKTEGEDLIKLLQDDLTALAAGFDSPRIAAADKCYNLIASMKRFVSFHFISVLRKFDPEIKVGDFLSQMKFVPVEGEIIMPDITSFVDVFPPFESDDDWKTVFEIIKYCKGGTDIIAPVQWNALLMTLKDLRESKIFDLIGRLITGNPILDLKTTVVKEDLSALWLEEKTREVRGVIAGIAGNQRQSQINTLEKAVFGIIDTNRLSNYSLEKNRILADKGADEFTYVNALNHLLAFIQDYLSKEINELCDIVLIRGQWTNTAASRQMSEAFHEVLDISHDIMNLDESLEDDGNNGSRLRGALLRVDRDKTQARYISSIVNSVNEEALYLINQAVPSLIVIGKHFKMLMDDYEKKPFELMMNWKELSLISTKVPLIQRITNIYKKINYFVQLMIMETKPVEVQP